MAQVIAREARAFGVRMCLAPVLGAAREPRWGRSEETSHHTHTTRRHQRLPPPPAIVPERLSEADLPCPSPVPPPVSVRSYGEDTYLISALARHFVWGLQGRALTNATVISEPKHYAAHSIPEGGRNTAVSHVGPRELLDTFLPQFESAVRAGALSIMSAYSEYDGVPCSGSHYLLTEVLRDTFGFRGFVLSDLGAVGKLADTHRVAATPEDGIKLFLTAGGNCQFYD